MDTQERAAAIVAGIDVRKAVLDVALRPGGEPWRCSNDEAGIAELVGRLQPLEPQRIVLEATGGV
jgi:transposase